MAFKQFVTQSQTSPKTVLNDERTSCDADRGILVIFVKSTELSNKCDLLLKDQRTRTNRLKTLVKLFELSYELKTIFVDIWK